jgi:uncharacterized protein involved in outer membrane biogenesis
MFVGFVVVAAGLAIIATLLVHTLTDPERLKTKAREMARTAWARDLAIGDISLRWQPLPTLYANDVSVVDPRAQDTWHVHADRVTIRLELWPLLAGQARPRAIRIEGDIGHDGHRLTVVAALDNISHYDQQDAVADGQLDLDWNKTHASVRGRIPLQPQLRGAKVGVGLESESLNDMLGFFGTTRPRATAPAHASLELQQVEERIELLGVDVTLGRHRLTGAVRMTNSGPRPDIAAELQSDGIDWPQLLLDIGDAAAEQLPPDELFYDRPLAWPLLVALQGTQGTIEAQIASLHLRSGLELQHFKASSSFVDDNLQVKRFTTDLLGGSAAGTMQFDGRKKEARMDVDGQNLLLERWFKERRKAVPFAGGPMKINAAISSSGDSLRDLARSMTGPVKISMGPGTYASPKAADAEAIMVAFSKKHSTGAINFECAAADLPFSNGLATGNGIVGARSDVSRLVTSGYVSMRDESVDLRGRVQPKPGMGVGLAAFAGEIRIAGKMRRMQVTLDPAASAKVAMRAAAAVLTLGLSVAGNAIADKAHADSDPCSVVSHSLPATR